MPAAKYTDETTYLLRMEAEDKRAYEAAARDARLSLADWINTQLRKETKRLIAASKRKEKET